MANFPALAPSVRSYIPGTHPSTQIGVLTGDEVSVRHSNGSTRTIVRLGFNTISRANHYAIVSHYSLHARFIPFSLTATTLVAANLTVPTNYQWIYVGPPEVEETCEIINVTVELELIPPYTI